METIDNTPDPPSVSQPAVVRPAPINVKVRFPQGSIAIRPNLWHNWTRIALRAETRAVAAHERGLMTGDTARALEDETLESMVAVSAARHAFHHLYLEWWQLLALKPENDESKVPELATTDVSTDPAKRKHWLGDLQDIVDDRNLIVHQVQESRPVVPHSLGTNTSELDALFTAERATRAVDLLLDFYHRVFTAPTPALAAWAAKRRHVPGQFHDARARYQADPSR